MSGENAKRFNLEAERVDFRQLLSQDRTRGASPFQGKGDNNTDVPGLK